MTESAKQFSWQSTTENGPKRPELDPSAQNPRLEAEATLTHEPADTGFVPYDESLLDVCRTRWQFGDWSRLAASEHEVLLHHPDRAKIGLLVAAAHFQLGQSQQGHRQLQLALDWGASRRQVMQILISGTHNSLAEASYLLKKPERAREHFREAMRTGGVPGDIELLAQAREARQTR
jgi:hypothetical protein